MLWAQNLKTVAFVDLKKYEGRWFENGKIPTEKETNCVCIYAQYEADPKKNCIKIYNYCYDSVKDDPRGVHLAAKADSKTHATWKVGVGMFKSSKYLILDLDENYKYALVASGDKKSLWLLGREREMPAAEYTRLLKKAESLGFDVTLIRKTDQTNCK